VAVVTQIWTHHLGWKLSALSPNTEQALTVIERAFDNVVWYGVYDFIEFVEPLALSREAFETACNAALEVENSGFRMFEGKVVSITNAQELAACGVLCPGASRATSLRFDATSVRWNTHRPS
jgi:hypothetical protein